MMPESAEDLRAQLTAARAELAEARRKLAEVRADALREAVHEIHTEARWQQEMVMRGENHGMGRSVDRLLMVGRILTARIAGLAAVGSGDTEPATEQHPSHRENRWAGNVQPMSDPYAAAPAVGETKDGQR